MVKWIIGLNGAGKTVYLENTLEDAIKNKENIVTNIRSVAYRGFNEDKIKALNEPELYEDTFDYGEIEVVNNHIIIKNATIIYTDNFMNLLTLLCREGDTLIIDEPEFGLYGVEIDMIVKIIEVLLPFYKKGCIATHCQELFTLQPNNFYWCDNYNTRKITEEELYEHIGQF
jgi:hypothetical protein